MSTKETHCGSCLCGAVAFEIEGEFDRFYLCHCSYCRKDTGSAHGANLFSSSAKIEWLSGAAQVKTYNVPATRHSKSFCSNCGSALPRVEMNGQLIVVPTGSLDSAFSMRPDAHLFVSSKAQWDREFETIQTFDTFPS